MKTLFYNGTVLTMTQPLEAEAVLVENGIIRRVGTTTELMEQAEDCTMVDLDGKTMLPGFIDPHSHLFQVAGALLQVSLNGAESSEEIGSRIDAFLRKNHPPKGQWIMARDYDNNLMPGLQNPTLEQLDSYAPGYPLVIHHKSGHMGLLNSEALRLAGITAQTPSPEGGRIEIRDGRLTGYLEENAFFNFLRSMPPINGEALMNAFTEAQKKYASYGITTVQDGMVTKEMLPMYRALAARDKLWLDVMLYPDQATWEEAEAFVSALPTDRHLHIGGMKMFLDGSPQGRTAWMRSPYEGSTDYVGYGTMTDEAVEQTFELAAKRKVQLIAHCNGDAASEQFLRCLEQAQRKYPILKQLRPVIIHGQLLGLDQLPRVRQLGAMVSFFVAHVYHWGDVHLRNFGKERASHISPAASALREGVPFTFHQDAPVIEPDMLETLWCATNRVTREGVVLGEEERISTLDALKAVTVHAAYQYGRENLIGAIAPGMRGDFVVLDGNPLEIPPQQLRSLHVEQTYKAGVCVFSR